MISPLGIDLRKESRLRLYNSIVIEFETGLKMDASVIAGFVAGKNVIRSTIFNNFIDISQNQAVVDAVSDSGLKNVFDRDLRPVRSPGSADYRAAGLPGDFGTVVTEIDDIFFDRVRFLGAMGPAVEDDWTAGWTTTDFQ